MTEIPRVAFTYPPRLDAAQLSVLTEHVKDYQLTQGSLIKLIRTSNEHSVLARPIGTSLFPSLFPRPCFEAAIALQQSYNLLYATVACDEAWLSEVLHDLINHDEFTAQLWDIYWRTKADRRATKQLELGIFRSDYMLQRLEKVKPHEDLPKDWGHAQLKQVEFNTYSCAGAVHGNIVSRLHRFMAKRGIYRECRGMDLSHNHMMLTNMPLNETLMEIAGGLARAYTAYRSHATAHYEVSGTCILMIVQPDNVNICDERPLEYELWGMEPSVPTFRVVFGDEVLSKTRLTTDGKLLYQMDPLVEVWEVAVLYMRAGYEPDEYTEAGIACRLQLERSAAIKCPGILTQLCTFKKVQQALTDPSAVARFLPPAHAEAILETFSPMYPLDTSPRGQIARKIALDPELASNHVLKPSLEGGGHNVYGRDIPAAIESIPESSLSNYVLMEMIQPPNNLKNILISPNGLYDGSVKSELGIYGICLWQQVENDEPKILENNSAGWSFKTKAGIIDEISVIKGYGVYDSPYLVDSYAFSKFTHAD